MSNEVQCSSCGQSIAPDDAVQGLCPSCLLKLGLSTPGMAPIPGPVEVPPPAKPAPARLPRRRHVSWGGGLAIAGGAILLVVSTFLMTARHYTRPPMGVVQFSISTAAEPEDFAVSPDGRRLAFTAAGEDGRTQLWIRSFDQLGERLLSGTEDASHPFWSPDSRWIAFFAEGKLKKVDISGGAQSLADAPSGQEGAWSPEGFILVADRAGKLSRVPSSGGIPEALRAFDRGSFRSPAFLPDGRHFLIAAAGSEAKQGGVYVADLASQEARRLGPGGAPAFAGGQVLFLRDGILLSQTLDLKSLELSDEPRRFPYTERVDRFSVSLNGVIAYRNVEAAEKRVVFLDRQGQIASVFGEPGEMNQVSLSPDGRSLAVSQRGDIWIGDATRGLLTRLTFDPGDDSYPLWSPDGKSIAFLSNRASKQGVYQKSIAGGEEDLLLQLPPGAMLSLDSWSPDGLHLLYAAADVNGKSGLWTVSLKGDHKSILVVPSTFNARQGSISPDGRWLVYTSEESGRSEIFLQEFPEARGKWQISGNGGTTPRWRQDGHELFYVAPGKRLMSVPVEVSVGGPKVGTPQLLLNLPREDYQVAPWNHFVLLQPVENGQSFPMQVIMNWRAELK